MIPSTWTVLAPREWMRSHGDMTAYMRRRPSTTIDVWQWTLVRDGRVIDAGRSWYPEQSFAAADAAIETPRVVRGPKPAPLPTWSTGDVQKRVYREAGPRVRASVTKVAAGIHRYEVREAGSIVASGYRNRSHVARVVCDRLASRCLAQVAA